MFLGMAHLPPLWATCASVSPPFCQLLVATIQNLALHMDIRLNFSCGMLHLYLKLKSSSPFMPLYMRALLFKCCDLYLSTACTF